MQPKRIVFLDERHVDHAYRLKREVTRPVPYGSGPIISPGKAYGTVLRGNDGRLKMWYLAQRSVKDMSGFNPIDKSLYCEAYAESDNGLEWFKPELNLTTKHPKLQDERPVAPNAFLSAAQVDSTGFELCGRSGPEGFCVLDAECSPHPGARARYTALYLSTLGEGLTPGYPHGETKGLCAAYSDDGLKWTAYRENPVIQGWPDTSNCCYYDQRLKKYVMYGRPNVYAATGSKHANRFLGRTESEDLVHWAPYKTILDTDDRDADPFFFLDETDLINSWHRHRNPNAALETIERRRGRNRQFYGISAFPYEDIYVGLVWVFDVLSGQVWLELAHSYDSVIWRREAVPTPFMEPRPGHWDSGMVFGAMASPPLEMGDDLWIYYSGSCGTHHGQVFEPQLPAGIGLRTLRKHRYLGYRADSHPGELITIPYAKPTSVLLDACIESDGQLQMAIVGPDGEEIAGFAQADFVPIEGDDSCFSVHFRTETAIKDIPWAAVRFRLRYHRAAVFGMTLNY